MRILLLTLLLGLLPAPSAAAEAPAVAPLAEAPWYDRDGDTWRRVVPRPPPTEDDGIELGGGGGSAAPFAILMYALVALAIVLLVAQLWRLRGGMRELDASARPAAPPPARLAALPFALPRDDRDPETALRAALAAGDLALAVIWLYALQLLRLDAAGAVRLAAGKTNRGYLHEAAAAAPGTAPALRATVAVFERSHFGHQPPSRGEVEDLLARHNGLVAALPAAEASR